METEFAPEVHGDDLTARLIGVGMEFTGSGCTDPVIERALADASATGMDSGDLPVLGFLVTWLEVHSDYINADRLIRTVVAHPSPRVICALACDCTLEAGRPALRQTGHRGWRWRS